jgi:hypothetical protein
MSIPDPDLRIEDFFRLLSNEFDINIYFETRGEFLIKFKDFFGPYLFRSKKGAIDHR